MSVLPPASEEVAPGRHESDVVIVGAGLAGLYAAVSLPAALDVVVVDKGNPGGRSGSSSWAQGGLAAAMGPDDAPALHVDDTVRAGDGLVDRTAAHVLAEEAPGHVARLVELGARFDAPDGSVATDVAQLHLAREGGQRVGRSVHRADATGAELIRTVRGAARDRVHRLQGHAVALARDGDGPIAGVWVVDADGQLVLVRARAVLLATGGCGGLFDATTNQPGATGDGVALAHAAGAAVRDMEFVQFHPTGLAVEGTWRFLLTEALRGAGATLHDDAGERFMPARHPDAELAPRHVVAGAILEQPGRRAWLDATHLGAETLEAEFPTVLHGARRYGHDLATERVPVTPAAHYMVGGVRTDLHGRTSLPGLYAAGEVASTGLHGANRMAGNSLSEALVFGARAAAAIAQDDLDHHGQPPPPTVDTDPVRPDLDQVRGDLRDAVSRGAGPVRTADGLVALRDDLVALASRLGTHPGSGRAHLDPGVAELRLAIATAELVRASALRRTESRGGHVRTDHPGADPAWAGIHLEHVRPGEVS